MRKWFVLSRRTLLSKKNVTEAFGSENCIIIPMAVLDEVQHIAQSQYDERGKIAYQLLEYLDSLDFEKLYSDGVTQSNGSILKVSVNYRDVKLPDNIKDSKLSSVEERVLKTCLGIQGEIPSDEKVVLISKNQLLRMKAKLAGIEAEGFRDELLLDISEQYTGRIQLEISDDMMNEFYNNQKIAVESIGVTCNLYENMFVVMKSIHASAIGRVQDKWIVPLIYGSKTYPYGVHPKNVGQKFMIEALMMDYERAPLVIVKGPAGTAKTFMALAAGLEQCVEHKNFPNNILISRSPTETGEKIGYLPGDEKEKISPYLRGIMDNLSMLHASDENKKQTVKESKKNSKGKGFDDYSEKPQREDGSELFSRGLIKAEAVGFIRGRSICDTFIIIDEAQNLTPTEMKTIITRVGIGTKLVILGDPAQIDRPELNERNNGLSYAAEHMKGQPTCWQITMTDEESVRSELAKIASILL